MRAPPHLDDHESQLALQQEEEALADAVGGVPGLGTGGGQTGCALLTSLGPHS